MTTSSRPTVLTTVPFPPALPDEIEADFVVLRYWEAEDQADWLRKQGADVRAIVTSGT